MKFFTKISIVSLFVFLPLLSNASTLSCSDYFHFYGHSETQVSYLKTAIVVTKGVYDQAKTAVVDYVAEVNKSPFKSRLFFVTPNEPPLKWGGLFRYEEREPKNKSKPALFRALDYVFDGLPRGIAKSILKDENFRFSPFFFIGRWLVDKPVRAVTREIFYSEKEFTIWPKLPIYGFAIMFAFKTWAIHQYDSHMPQREQAYLEIDYSKNHNEYERAISTDYRFNRIRLELERDGQKITALAENSQPYKQAIQKAQYINSSIQSYYRLRAESGLKLHEKQRSQYSEEEITQELDFQIQTFGDHALFLDIHEYIGKILTSRPPTYQVNGPSLLSEGILLDLFLSRHVHLMRLEYLDMSFNNNLAVYKEESRLGTQSDLYKMLFNNKVISEAVRRYSTKYGSNLFSNSEIQASLKAFIQEYLEVAHKLEITTIANISLHDPTPPHVKVTIERMENEFLSRLENL